MIRLHINNKIDKSLHRLYYGLCNVYLELVSYLRKYTGITFHFKKLKSLHNKYEGRRCFIIATGPSLTVDDVLLLKDEYTIGMNNVCLLYDKIPWRANMLGVQDKWVYEKIYPVLKTAPQNVFVSSEIGREYSNSECFNRFPLNFYYHLFDFRYSEKLSAKFSDNAFRMVYDAYSITFSLMQIAVYMGFKEIYLLGCDCNQAVGKVNHFMENGHEESSEKLATSADRNIFGHTEIKKFCDERGVKVYNATRGGALEVYPRVRLEDVLSNKNHEYCA